MINPQWLELPMSRTNFYGPKDVRAIEVPLYMGSDMRNVPSDMFALQIPRPDPQISCHCLPGEVLDPLLSTKHQAIMHLLMLSPDVRWRACTGTLYKFQIFKFKYPSPLPCFTIMSWKSPGQAFDPFCSEYDDLESYAFYI